MLLMMAVTGYAQTRVTGKVVSGEDGSSIPAMAKFLKAYYFNLMSQKLGDIPMSQALKGVENKTPEYDAQKQVYIQILNQLDEANSEMGISLRPATPSA